MEKLRTEKANRERSRKADEFAQKLYPVLLQCAEKDCIKPSEIIAYLDEQGIKTARGDTWSREQLRRVQERIKKLGLNAL